MSTVSTATTEPAAMSQYRFSNTYDAGSQLGLLAEILDDHTSYALAGTGLTQGWRCLDVGYGAGTATRWIAERVGPAGHVTALDLQPHPIEAAGNITVLTGDVRTIDLPQGHYNLIHARLVLLHLAEREQVLQRLVAALAPGGVLVVSDWETDHADWLLHTASTDAADAFDAFQRGLLAELQAHGADIGWARRVPLAMRAAGLIDITAVTHSELWAGRQPGCLLHLSNAKQLRTALLERGVTTTQLELLETAMLDPATLAYGYRMVTSVGHRPEK